MVRIYDVRIFSINEVFCKIIFYSEGSCVFLGTEVLTHKVLITTAANDILIFFFFVGGAGEGVAGMWGQGGGFQSKKKTTLYVECQDLLPLKSIKKKKKMRMSSAAIRLVL